MNQGTFAGVLGRDAELRHTPGGHTVLNFSVAVNTGFGDNKKTLWVSCALWGERGQKLEQYLTKGTRVAVSGNVDLRTYEARDKTTKAELMLNVQQVTLQGGGERSEDRPARQADRQQAPAATAGTQAEHDFDDDIPF